VSHEGRGAGRYRTLGKVTLRLFDTASRGVREFQPGTPGQATVSLCGGGAAGAPHLGQLRSAVCFDILVRWLEASGLRVTYCRNVADIDDEILAAAAAAGAPWWTLAERHQREFAAACARLGCRAPDAEPRATGHVPDMLVLVERLLAGGHAYQAGGDVYFSAGPGTGPGTLSGRGREQRDFVLWRAAKPGEPSWRSPWGRGRPGRPAGCAAMAAGYLGPRPDIHGGGQDLVFPHHENERALSGAAGTGAARYWVHHGLVTVGGTKMSRPAGNALTLPDALRQVRPQELRYYLAQAHYRSPVDYSPAALRDAAAAYRRIERFAARARGVLAGPETGGPGIGGPGIGGPGGQPVPAAAFLRLGPGRRPLRAGRTGRRARDSPRWQLRSRYGGPGDRGRLPGAGAGHARGSRSRSARSRLAGRRTGRRAGPAARDGGRAGRPGARAAGSGARAARLRRGGLDPGHPGKHRGAGRGHPRRPSMGTSAMNFTTWRSMLMSTPFLCDPPEMHLNDTAKREHS
jgi:cysteinyl-tRNA synthetase